MKLARSWITQFDKVSPEAIPRDAIDISYSRSSGPGGQNVNKVSTKATVRLLLARSQSFLPPYTISNLTQSTYSVKSSTSSNSDILVSSSTYRTQPDNLRDCLFKIKNLILNAAKQGIVGETSSIQKIKVKQLAQIDKARTKVKKKQRKDVKGGRRTGKGSFSID
ncbi:hypothetical protein OIO90_004002 [Microbotryomycetes sp. JL221]|nr:hypothetical protein OIO90_004002 [Microbotryomycetes sp. JL221]